MFTINLEEKLVREKKRTIESLGDDIARVEGIVSAAGAILDDKAKSDVEFLSVRGFSGAIGAAKVANMAAHTTRAMKQALIEEGRLFTESEIRSVCLKYRLRFLSVSSYRGHIDPSITQKMRAFEEKHGKVPYFIVAPAESFELRERPVDPLLFAQTNGGYYLVAKWGDDLSVFRRVLGFMTVSRRRMWVVVWSGLALLLGVMVGVGWANWGGEGAFVGGVAWIVPAFVLGMLADMRYLDRWASHRIVPSDRCWDSDFR